MRRSALQLDSQRPSAPRPTPRRKSYATMASQSGHSAPAPTRLIDGPALASDNLGPIGSAQPLLEAINLLSTKLQACTDRILHLEAMIATLIATSNADHDPRKRQAQLSSNDSDEKQEKPLGPPSLPPPKRPKKGRKTTRDETQRNQPLRGANNETRDRVSEMSEDIDSDSSQGVGNERIQPTIISSLQGTPRRETATDTHSSVADTIKLSKRLPRLNKSPDG